MTELHIPTTNANVRLELRNRQHFHASVTKPDIDRMKPEPVVSSVTLR